MQILVNNLKNNIIKGYKIIIACAVIFLSGFLIGIIFEGVPVYDYFYKNVFNYYGLILGIDSFSLTILFIRIINNLLLFILFFLCSLTIYTFFLSFLLILYKGIILGIAAKIFFLEFGIGGIFIFLFLVLIQSLIVLFALCYFLSISFFCLLQPCNCLIKKLAFKALFCFCLSLIGAIWEFLLLICFFRPINFYF